MGKKGEAAVGDETAARIRRWRLILGEESEERFSHSEAGGPALSEEDQMLDAALSAIYNSNSRFRFGEGGPQNGPGGPGGRGPSNPTISRWLGDIRTLFDPELVKIIQTDAMERCGLKQLLFEPELLRSLEPDIHLASTLLLLKDEIPKRSKEDARAFIQKIVEEINALLESDLRRAVTAALNRRAHSPIPSASALDFKTTIRRGIRNYRPELGKLVPEKYYFFERSARTAANKHTIILDIDQSGSMGESVIYSSIMSCILASMSSLRTRIVAFDTNVVDLTEKSDDPIDLLFGFQLGGGTDINRSIAYCESLIENPGKTMFFLISDLCEGGNQAGMLRRLQGMKESGVTVVCLLAVQDGGKPYYDKRIAERIAQMQIPCFACSPQRLPELLEKTLKGMDLTGFSEEEEKS